MMMGVSRVWPLPMLVLQKTDRQRYSISENDMTLVYLSYFYSNFQFRIYLNVEWNSMLKLH